MQKTLKSLLPFPVVTNLHPFQKHLSKVTQKQYSLKLNHHDALLFHCKTGVLYSPGYLFSLGAFQPGFFDSLGFLKAQGTKIQSLADYLYSTQQASKNCLCCSLFIFFQNLTKGEAMYKFEAIIVKKPVHNCSHIYIFFTWLIRSHL